MSHRVEAAGASGMPRDEDQFVLRRAGFAPLQEVLNFGGTIVLIDAEKADVQIVARVFKIVRIAAEERDLLFGSKHQAHVGVLLELIQVILPPLEQRDYVASQTRLLELLLFDRIDRGAASQLRLGGR